MKNILVLSYSEDPHADVVCNHLKKQGNPYVRVNTENFFKEGSFSFDSRNLEFKLSFGDKNIILDSSYSIWNRRILDPEIDDVDNLDLIKIIHNETRAMWKGFLTSHKGLVVNNPFNVYNASNKIDQLIFASNYAEINIPDTLVTNDIDELKKFWTENNGEVCFKLQKGAVVQKKDKYFAVYTNMLKKESLENPDLIRKNPHLFQRYKDKTYEVRVVAIGKESIGTAIHSQKSEKSKIDFRRYDFDNVPYEHIKLPENISEFCRSMLKNYGLHFGVFDFIFHKDEGYTFLELNPNGQWLWLEEYSGYNISKVLADYLSNS